MQRCERLIGEGRALLAAGRAGSGTRRAERRSRAVARRRLGRLSIRAFAQGGDRRLGELRAALLEERITVEMLLGRDAQVLGELERSCASTPTASAFGAS